VEKQFASRRDGSVHGRRTVRREDDMKLTRYALAISAFVLAALAAVASAGENVWVSHGPTDAALVTDIAIADSVAYAATANGVFRSHDRGETWQPSGLDTGLIDYIVAQSGAPVVLAHEWWTGTLYASRDGGESWVPVSGLPSDAIVAGIDPGQPSIIYVVTSLDPGLEYHDTIWKSTDAGVSWQATSSKPGSFGRPRAFAFDSPAVYLLTEESLYKTLDGGVTWTSAEPTFGTPSAIAVSATAGTIYAAIGQGFCRSADWAATWTCSFSLDTYSYVARMVEVPGDTPATPRLVAGYDRGIIVSRDRGATWASSSDGPDTRTPALAYDASGSFALAGTDTQVFRSEDAGDTWTPFRAGLNAVVIGALALDPQNPSTIWAGGPPGLFRSTDTGLSWSPAGGLPGSGNVNALAIDPENPRTMYARSPGIHRSEDGGETWTPSLSTFGSEFFALDPADHRRIWAGDGAGIRSSGSGLHYSDDGARTFRSVPSVTQTIYSILFDQRRPGSIYGGSYDRILIFGYPYAVGGSIFVSRDNGLTFTKGATNFGDRVRSMATDPFEDILYAATDSRGVFRSLDGGTTWEAAGAVGPPFGHLFKIIADPVRRGRLYASTTNGVFRSTDAARTWEHIGLTYTSIGFTTTSGELVITPDGRRLYAGTSGGVFELDLDRPEPCSPTATRLCLVGGRYAVDLLAGRRGEPAITPGTARSLSDRSGYFSLPFATGDAELPEVVVKMLADGTFGTAGAPFFYSSLTTVNYRLTVTDTMTGEETVYVNNPDQPFCGRTDLLFDEPETPLSLRSERVAGSNEAELELLGGRFSVTLEARRQRDGRIAGGVVTASGDVYGIFSLPGITGDSTFPEVAVKMVDARSFANGMFWFFHTGLTSLEYTLTVTDSVTGAVQTYANTTPFCGAADTDAFTD
jgi:photosystem II stability/assembly factor-like uncharacterized protein